MLMVACCVERVSCIASDAHSTSVVINHIQVQSVSRMQAHQEHRCRVKRAHSSSRPLTDSVLRNGDVGAAVDVEQFAS